MKIKIYFPTEEEIEQSHRFRTYLNYLMALSEHIGDASGAAKDLARQIVESRAFRGVQGGRCQEPEKVGKLLRNAWFTELQLYPPHATDEFIPYANHWAPVQAYYAVYLMIRAYFVCCGREVPHRHSTTLRVMANEIQRRPDLFPLPWRVLCVGDPFLSIPQLTGLPSNIVPSKVSSLLSWRRVSFWDSYALFLKTTRKRQLEALCEQWKVENNKKRMNSEAKKRYISNLGPTSLFHALYRLRLRSNYVDADSFLMSYLDSSESKQFNAAISNITYACLLLFEVLIPRYLGKRIYQQFVDSFKHHDPAQYCAQTLLQRWQLIRNLW